MAPEISQEVKTQTAANWEVELTQKAAENLSQTLPFKNAKQLAEELLIKLLTERKSRQDQNLDHWPEHAPRFLKAVIRAIKKQGKSRKREIEAFFKANHEEALKFAEVMLKNERDAEEVVAETYVAFLKGKTEIRYFFRALRDNARDKIRIKARQVKRTHSLNAPPYVVDEDEEECIWKDGTPDSFPDMQLVSSLREDSNPLDILVNQEEVRQAKKDPRWRYIKRKKWAQRLV